MINEIAILGSGKYIPQKVILSSEIDRSIGKKEGYTEGKTGVHKRHFINGETASYMGAKALLEAVSKAELDLSELDCIVCASGTIEQPIPCTASLIQEQLSLSHLKIPCFDINSTCLSFVVALDLMSYLISAGRYKNVAIVSTEISSVGLNWEDEESSMLFGDGAVAVIIGKSNKYKDSKIIASSIMTISEGAHYSEIYGGGTKLSPHEYSEENKLEFTFKMQGRKLFRKVCEEMDDFVADLFSKTEDLKLDEMDYVIPHQASRSAMELMRKRLKISEDKWASIIHDYGNMIAASIPLALHFAIEDQKIKRGDKVFLLGTSAGLSIGGVVLQY